MESAYLYQKKASQESKLETWQTMLKVIGKPLRSN